MKQTILVVDDEKDIVTLLEYNLQRAGFNTISALDGPDAIDLARSRKPDLIILDIMLPSMDGMEICKILKGDPNTSHIPIIMLTARGEEVDRILGFELGADDYITKPFSPRELVLRVKAVLKRQRRESSLIKKGNISIDIERHEVLIGNESINLTPKEFEILVTLVKGEGKVMSRETLLNLIWGEDCFVTDRTVDAHIKRLREKLGEYGRHIETVRGFGYRFRDNL